MVITFVWQLCSNFSLYLLQNCDLVNLLDYKCASWIDLCYVIYISVYWKSQTETTLYGQARWFPMDIPGDSPYKRLWPEYFLGSSYPNLILKITEICVWEMLLTWHEYDGCGFWQWKSSVRNLLVCLWPPGTSHWPVHNYHILY